MARNIVITGATSGLGKYITETLLRQDDHLILLGRNEHLLEQLTKNSDHARYYVADFANASEVKAAGTRMVQDYDRIDLVFCNAGILGKEELTKTPEGIEETFMTNYLAHYILLYQLFSVRTVPRVMITGSQAAQWYSINFNDIMSLESYRPLRAYGISKACLQMLGGWLYSSVPGTEVNIIDPGTFRSGIDRSRAKWFRMLYGMAKWAMRSPAAAARDAIAILDGKKFPGGAIIRRGKAKDLHYTTEEFGKLIEKSTALSGCDISSVI